MKIIQYDRYTPSPYHIHGGISERLYYIPELHCLIGTSVAGTFGMAHTFINEDPDFIKEAEAVERNETPKVDNVTFSRYNNFELDSEKLIKLVSDLRSYKQLEKSVENQFAELFPKK